MEIKRKYYYNIYQYNCVQVLDLYIHKLFTYSQIGVRCGHDHIVVGFTSGETESTSWRDILNTTLLRLSLSIIYNR